MEKRFEGHFSSINEKVSQRLDTLSEVVTSMMMSMYYQL